MDIVKDEIVQIKEVLKKNPRGINVIDIAKAVNMNRQTVTKYLEMLVVSGNVDVKTFGPSKVYYLSQRLPVSSMISLSSDFILILDRNLNIINVNEPFLNFTKAKKENIIGKAIDAIRFPLEFDPPIKPYISEALDGKECRIEANYTKRGSENCYGIKFIPVVFEDGQPGASIMFEDITERKQAEEALRDSESNLRQTERILYRSQEAGKVGSWHLDLRKNDLWWSPETYRLFGFPPDKKLGYEDFLLIVHDEDREKVNRAWESALAGEPYDIEHRIVIDGQVKWMHEKAVLDFNENGTPVFGIGTVTDITERKRVEVELKEKQEELEAQAEELEMQMEELRTKNEELEVQIMERKRAEEALNDNEKKFKTLFDLLPVGISILDKDRGIVKTNVALENILGIDKDGFNKGVYQRRKYLRADGTEMPANEFPSSRSFNENKNVENVEICVVKEDGSAVWTNVSAVQMPYRDWAMVLTTSNITGLKQAEKSLERTIQQLKESNEQLSAIKTVTESAMSTLNLTELLNSILNSIMRVMNADAIVILLREDDYVRVRASIGFGKDDISQFSVPIGTGFAGKIAGSGQPQYIEDAQTDKIIASSVLKNAGIRSIIGVPIRHMGEVIGVLHVEWMTIHPFNKQEQDFLQILADSCSASIINAKLFEKTKTGE